MDSTYKTSHYALSLSVLAVKTNYKYMPVSFIFLEKEDINSYEEALDILKIWNNNWHPKVFMMDYARSEISSVRNIFKNAEVKICKFHRIQAIKRWLRKSK